MIYYRCKCGETKAWGSMPPYPCDKCRACGSDLALGPDAHAEPKPHEFVPYPVETDAGPVPLTRCRWCGRTPAEAKRP